MAHRKLNEAEKTARFESQIHVYRAMRRMTQQELADKIGLSRKAILDMERNRYNPSLLTAYKISQLFAVPIESIFEFKKKK